MGGATPTIRLANAGLGYKPLTPACAVSTFKVSDTSKLPPHRVLLTPPLPTSLTLLRVRAALAAMARKMRRVIAQMGSPGE